jgi:hypothetical protein
MFHAKDNLPPTLEASSLTLNSVRWPTDGDIFFSLRTKLLVRELMG